MTWVRLDDRWMSHPKAAAAGPLGRDLFIGSLCYCGAYLTDGFIPEAVLPSLAPRSMSKDGTKRGRKRQEDDVETLSRRLVDVGLWERVDGGWKIHDYLDWQQSRAEANVHKAAKREAGRRGGIRSAQARRQAPATADAQAPATARASSRSQPDVAVYTPPSPLEADASEKARRLPDPFDWFNPEHWDLAMALPEDKRPPGWTAHRRRPGLRP